jgi:hypothetical protein
MEVKMFSAHTQQIKWLLFPSISVWQVNPDPLTFTESEYIGDPAEEYAEQETDCTAKEAQIPEIEADEFESVYQWFLA